MRKMWNKVDSVEQRILKWGIRIPEYPSRDTQVPSRGTQVLLR